MLSENVGIIYHLDDNLIKRILSGKYTECSIPYETTYLLALKNGYLMTISKDLDSKSICLYDENLVLKKQVSKINNEKIEPTSLASNDKDRFYIVDTFNDRILMTDYEFNFIKCIGFYGSLLGEFMSPLDVIFKDDYLYVTDYGNNRVQKLNSDLEMLGILEFPVGYCPFVIENIDDTLCIIPWTRLMIYFYDLNNFSLKNVHTYADCSAQVFNTNSNFYRYNQDGSNSLTCYDINGNQLKKVQLKDEYIENIKTKENVSHMISFNGKILMLFSKQQKIVLI